MRATRSHRAIILSVYLWGCASIPAYALDLTPDSAPMLSDPAYLPSGRHLVGATAYELADTSTLRALSQSLSYGVLNDFTVSASASYAWSEGYFNYSSGLDAPTFSNRFEPVVGVTGRLLDQGPHPINLDISVAAPEQIGTAVSWQTRDLTILGRLGAYYASRNTDVDRRPVIDPFLAYFVQLQSQLRLTHVLAFNLGLKYTNAVGSAAEHQSNAMDFGAQLSYQLIDDRLVLQAGYNEQSPAFSANERPTIHTVSIGLLYAL